MLISSSFAFGESSVCRLGGGDSHNYYKSESRTLRDISRTRLVSLKQDLRKAANHQDQMTSIVYFLGSPSKFGWMLNGTALSENAASTSYDVVDDALDLYTSSNARFNVYYDIYKSEVPGTGFIKITRITSR